MSEQIDNTVQEWVNTWRKPTSLTDDEYTLIVGNLNGFYQWLRYEKHADGVIDKCAELTVEIGKLKTQQELDTTTLKELWPVFYAARELEQFLGANSGSTADWPVQLLARGEAEADKLTGLMDALQTKIKAVKLNPVTVEDWKRFQ